MRTLKQVVYENDLEIGVLYELLAYKTKNPDFKNIFLLFCEKRFESYRYLTGFQINILNEILEDIKKKEKK